MVEFSDVFKVKKPVIGMIHLAGENPNHRRQLAVVELADYEKGGIDGAIVENYHGSKEDVIRLMRYLHRTNHAKIAIGVNILGDPYSSFEIARRYGGKFVQFDSVESCNLDLDRYEKLRRGYPEIAVLGGVEFKYSPFSSMPL